ncbi:MAG: BrnA antitoxin family protein [Rhodothermales bacterium]
MKQSKKHTQPLTPQKLADMPDEEIDYSDIPETDAAFWASAHVVMPGKKKAVSLRLDLDVLEWFKAQGRGYQTRINAVLRSYMDAHK